MIILPKANNKSPGGRLPERKSFNKHDFQEQHTFGTHPEQPLPTGYLKGFLSWLGNKGL